MKARRGEQARLAQVSPLRPATRADDHSGSRTVLITGGAGFIGSHLCDRLVQKGWRVICLDNLYTGELDNIRPLLNHPRFEFRDHDVTEPISITGPVHRIYNLACPASPRHYQRDPIGTMMTCTLGAANVLNLAKQKSARVLLASTSEVYGDPEVHPQKEDYLGHVNAIGPRACYDEGKRAAETLFFDYWRSYGVAIKVARIFNTYGPRMVENDGRVVSNFIVQALRSEPITIYGTGQQTRSFCFVDDLVVGLELLMESGEQFVGPCNLGNPQEVTIREVAERIIAQTGARSELRFLPLPQDDPKRRRPRHRPCSVGTGLAPARRARSRAEGNHRVFQSQAVGIDGGSDAPQGIGSGEGGQRTQQSAVIEGRTGDFGKLTVA